MTPPHFDRSMHGYRVSIGHGGPSGVLRRCYSRKTGAYFWRVYLDDQSWEWPNRIVCESTGAYTSRCSDCELEFRSDAPNAHVCPNCVRVIERAHGEEDPFPRGPSHKFGSRPRR